ncbi:MAG: TonB-dependent receptor plug domain-containing protein [Nitrosomonas sp.]|nr:TonB-dependent receptor plug domain-containing protein [Nitrosomonas sp.]MDP1951204.1 TonB-dependent receptor plug domain-containing protein [Nitrosomonas sp.]
MLIILKQFLFTSSAYLIVVIVFVFSQNAEAQNATASSEPTNKRAYTNMHEITVTATRTNRKVSDVPESVSVVDTEQLQTRQAADIGDVLRYLPNVELGGGPRNLGMNPNIRGLGDARILFLLDGARQDFRRGHNSRIFIDPAPSGLISYVDQHHPLGAVAPWVA